MERESCEEEEDDEGRFHAFRYGFGFENVGYAGDSGITTVASARTKGVPDARCASLRGLRESAGSPTRLGVLKFERGQPMSQQKAREVLQKHNISTDDVRERKASLHHLRNLVHAENLPFEVFREVVTLRR
jgi:hypothetical protein